MLYLFSHLLSEVSIKLFCSSWEYCWEPNLEYSTVRGYSHLEVFSGCSLVWTKTVLSPFFNSKCLIHLWSISGGSSSSEPNHSFFSPSFVQMQQQSKLHSSLNKTDIISLIGFDLLCRSEISQVNPGSLPPFLARFCSLHAENKPALKGCN